MGICIIRYFSTFVTDNSNYFNIRQLHSILILSYGWDGDTYTGEWDGLKGQGEISYTDGTKYTGHWDKDENDDDKLKKHGFGTLYSADGQVLNQGKWDMDKYVGNE